MHSYDELMADRLPIKHQVPEPQHNEEQRRAQSPALLRLQQKAGNRAVQRLIQRRASDSVPEVAPEVAAEIQQARGMGQPLDRALLAQMEPAFGVDFSQVRVHTDAQADTLSRAVQARAFTTGSDLFFRQGAYQPSSSSGRALLAHELTHVVQQQGATIQTALAVSQPGDRFEQEAEHVAQAVIQHEQVAPSCTTQHSPRLAVQREVADAATKSKPAWSQGPTSKRKRVSHTLAEYIGWVREVEQVYGENHAEIVQRLRRVYYSGFSGAAGPRFDMVINQRWSMTEPLSSPPLRIETLNGLYETDYIITPSGGKLDVSHLFAGLDVSLTGSSAAASTVGATYALRSREVNWAGVLTWVGDLASWFREWVAKKHDQEDKEQRTLGKAEHQSLLLRLTGAKVDKDDLLGDMDAHVMAQRYTTLGTHRDPFASSLEDSVSLINTLSAPVSSILETFYQPQPGASTTLQEINRFALFIRAAQPTIPHQVIQADPLRVRLADDAKDVIHRYIADTARVFLEVGGGDKRYATDELLTRYDHILWNIAWYFVRFLNTGLERGDAPWP